MIQYTNHHNLPVPLFNALIASDYDAHDSFVSVTSLIDSPYIWKMRKHTGDPHSGILIHEDASSRLWALLGSAIHNLVDKAGADYITEFRASATILGKKISGKNDLFNPYEGVMSDYKVTTKYSIKGGKSKIEWERQLNVLAFLFRRLGLTVTRLEIIAILRDFMFKDKFSYEFPDIPMKIVPIPMWSNTEQEHYVESRTALFIKYDETPITQLEPCNKEERWASDITYACIKKGATKATKLFADAISAQQYADEKGLMIELREASDPRCTEYCSFVKICPYARSKGYDKA